GPPPTTTYPHLPRSATPSPSIHRYPCSSMFSPDYVPARPPGWHASSHTLQRTVATHLGDSDLAPTVIADQLGNTVGVVETHYRRKRVANEAVTTASRVHYGRLAMVRLWSKNTTKCTDYS